MKKFIIPALVGMLLLPALPGTGQTSLNYVGASSTDGLSVTVMGQGLMTGVTTSRVQSAATDSCAGVACATAAGAAEPFGTTVTAVSPGMENPDPAVAFDVGDTLSPELEQIIAGSLGAARASAGSTTSTGVADGIDLDITINQTLLGQLPPELTEPLDDVLGQIAEGLAPIAEGDPTGTIGGLTDALTTLVGDLTSRPIASINGAASTSTSTFATGTVTTEAMAAGALIVILPATDSTPLVPSGLAVIEGGPSMVSATANGTTPATAEASASIIRITLLPGILDALPDIGGEGQPGLGDLPLGDIIDQLPQPIQDLLPPELIDPLTGGGGDGEPTEEPTTEPTTDPSEDPGGPTGTPIDDLIPPTSANAFMQADEDSGGFVIELATGAPETCILEGTPLETCILVGGTDTTPTDDGLGIGVLAAGASIELLRTDGEGAVEIAFGRTEGGVNAQLAQAPATPTPTPTAATGMPQTGAESTFVLPALLLIGLSGVSLVTLRRNRT